MGLCASTLGGPVTTGRHGTRRPRAREGPPAVSVKTRHFASRPPPPPAIPVFPLPTRAGSHAQALARARGPTLSRCSTTGLAPERDPLFLEWLGLWALAQAVKPLSREARAFGLAPLARDPLSLSREARAFGLAPKHEAPLEREARAFGLAPLARDPRLARRESLHSRVPTVHFLGALG